MDFMHEIKFDDRGLVPAIAQDVRTDEVLMLAWMNRESLQRTLETGRAHYYSRSRQALWLKGETSGHFQDVRSISCDCDGDTLLLRVEQTGAACHTGHRSCFYRKFEASGFKTEEQKSGSDAGETKTAEPVPAEIPSGLSGSDVLQEVFSVIKDRQAHPREGSYTNYLFGKGLDKILKKIGEEASETIIAAKNGDMDEIKAEISDLLYHIMVLLAERGMTPEDVYGELRGRR